ncbi:hypothetical protein C8Q80DRAFT_1081418, partial [Daedaleopsis nitida]
MRKFDRETCSQYTTRELPNETESQTRQGASAHATRSTPSQCEHSATVPRDVKSNVLNMYKYHCLGDYAKYIERSGPTDNYTTQGELEHRHSKRWYAQTNRIHFEFQIVQKQQCCTVLEGIQCLNHATNCCQGDALAPVSPTLPYKVSTSPRTPANLYSLLENHRGDPALDGFIPRLHEHPLSRFLPGVDLTPFSDEHHDGLFIYDDQLLRHKVLRVNYTTYDMCRDQDSINPRTHPNVMLLANNTGPDSHSYWYARIIDLFHAKVRYTGPGSNHRTWKWQRLELAWVCWLEYDTKYKLGFVRRRLPRVRFINLYDTTDDFAFGFINPDDIIRAAYLMPVFVLGRTDEYLGPSKLARLFHSDVIVVTDYPYYKWIDRDMYMRYHGGGIGHR